MHIGLQTIARFYSHIWPSYWQIEQKQLILWRPLWLSQTSDPTNVRLQQHLLFKWNECCHPGSCGYSRFNAGVVSWQQLHMPVLEKSSFVGPWVASGFKCTISYSFWINQDLNLKHIFQLLEKWHFELSWNLLLWSVFRWVTAVLCLSS